MDPVTAFGVASGATGVVSLGITVAQGLLNSHTSVKDARQDIARLYKAANQLMIILSHLQTALQKIKNLDSTVQEAERQILSTRSSIEQLEAMLKSDKFKITAAARSS